MAIKTYNRTNFHRHTFCVFQKVDLETIENKKPDYKSKSGSSYYFTDDGVYRLSNHWGRAANCKWRLAGMNVSNASRTKVGFALWNSFYSDNDSEKHYFIAVDYETKTVQYQHKDSTDFKAIFMLRTASETTKIIKEIRNLFTNDSWAKHFEMPIDVLRNTIIEQLITTNEPLIEIKRKLRNSL
ncbi:hypothetical protein [Flavobacterium sp.]|uniref:hypothetical protein n=1 Tax=Flavobacterium sp. TaxID=239 RepID=UPI00286B876E|nr:hypothetical protein [Flavobacterium sp.]